MADQGLSTDAPAFEAPAAGAGGDAPAEGAEGGVLDAAAAGLNTDAAPFVMPGAAGETAPVSSSVSGYAGLAGRPDMKGIMAAEDYAKELAIVQADPDSPYASAKSFDELGLSAELLKGISLLGYAKPSKIQEVTLPVICTANKKGGFPNLIAQAKNGSGKTAAFVLGMLARCDLTRNVTQSVCLSPTRELAQQNYKAVLDMGVFVKPDVYLAISDVAGQPKLKRGKAIASQIVVGTPGRVKGMIQAKNLSLKDVIVFVLDEADNMVNSKDGLGAQVGGIAKSLSPTCQRLLFSATFEDHVWKFAETFTSRKGERPFTLRLKAEELKIEKLRQYYITVETEQEKMSKLAELYDVLELTYQSIIFVNTIKTATELTTYMRSMGHTCTALHGRGMDKVGIFGKKKEQERGKLLDGFVWAGVYYAFSVLPPHPTHGLTLPRSRHCFSYVRLTHASIRPFVHSFAHASRSATT